MGPGDGTSLDEREAGTPPFSSDGSQGNTNGEDDASSLPAPSAWPGGDDGNGNLQPLPAPVQCGAEPAVLACTDGARGTRGAAVSATSIGANMIATDPPGYAVATTTDDNQAATYRTDFAPLLSGAIHLRFSLFLPFSPALTGINIVSLGQIDDPDFGLDLNIVDDGSLELLSSGDSQTTKSSGFDMPRGRWLCVSVDVPDISNQGSAVVSIDGHAILVARNLDTLPGNGIAEVGAGIDRTFGGQAGLTAQFDNLVVATAPLSGCP